MTRKEHIAQCLQEECAEIIKEASKANRFTLEDKVTLDPYGPRGTEGPTNSDKIGTEFIDLIAVYLMGAKEGLFPKIAISINSDELMEAIMAKQRRVEDYMVYAARVGALTDEPSPVHIKNLLEASNEETTKARLQTYYSLRCNGIDHTTAIADARQILHVG